MIKIAEIWLPLIATSVLWGIAPFIWAQNKIASTWLVFAGATCLGLLAILHWQEAIRKNEAANKAAPSADDVTANRAYIGQSFAAVLLDSPAHGEVTAWYRVKNTGNTPAYKVRGWLLFYIGPSTDVPFTQKRPARNETVLSPGTESNLFDSKKVSAAQIRAIEKRTDSFFVWGRIDYEDVYGRPHFEEFKGRMDGPKGTVVVDGLRAEGWGFNPISEGMKAD